MVRRGSTVRVRQRACIKPCKWAFCVAHDGEISIPGRVRDGYILGLAGTESVTLLRRAALAHDLGRVGVSNAIWEKPGPLGFGEWERVRLHPHFSERAFAQSPALAPIGLLAGSHHERLDGSGHHRGVKGPALDQAARILAAADAYAAVRGQSNQEIADAVGISVKTVGHHVQHVYRKAGVRSRAAAALGLRARPR